jgi:hypothetical protein
MTDAVGCQIRVHRDLDLCLYRSWRSGLGWVFAIFSHPALTALVVVLFVL